jgi:hypothetical protein
MEFEATPQRGEDGQISLKIAPQLTFHLGDAVFGEGQARVSHPEFVSLELTTELQVHSGRFCLLGILKSPEDLVEKHPEPKSGRNLRIVVMAKVNSLLCAPRGLKIPPQKPRKEKALQNVHVVQEYFEVEKDAAENLMAQRGNQADATAQLRQCNELIPLGKARRIETCGISMALGKSGRSSSIYEQPHPDDSKEGSGGIPMDFAALQAQQPPPAPIPRQARHHNGS